LSALDPLKQVTTEHVLKALLQENAPFSLVNLLKDLNVDLETSRKRTDINTNLMERPEVTEDLLEVPKAAEAGYSSDYSLFPWQSWSATAFFDKQTAAIVHNAWIYPYLLSPLTSERSSPFPASKTKRPKHPELGLHHLLTAFRKLRLLSEHVNKIIAIVDERHLTETIIGANLDDSVRLQDDAKSALLSARMLAGSSIDGLITPLMLLDGMVNQFDSILYTNADLEQLGYVARQIRQELAENLGNADKQLLLTQRMTRVLQFAKAEALAANHPLVRAPHLVLALLRETLTSEIAFVTDREFDVEKFRIAICREHDIFIRSNFVVDPHSTIKFAPECRGFLLLARDKARDKTYELIDSSIDLNHLALALLEAQKWLRDLIEGFTGLKSQTLVRRLEQCSYSDLNYSTSGYSSTFGIVVSLDEIDD
jgi:hypothetical protein